MWPAAFAKARAANSPAPNAARKGAVHGATAFAFEIFGEADFDGGFAQETFLSLSHEPFGGTIHQAQTLFFIERENGDVEFSHGGANQRNGFHGAEALFAQALA